MRTRQPIRGVSLIEALVALAVMAIGLLGVVGMQGALRGSGDLSKQRSEAVRMAQETVEDLRAFGVLSGAPPGEHDYSKIVSSASPATVAVTAGFANTTFERSVVVTDPSATEPRMKTVSVRVAWFDRTGNTSVAADERFVVLNTAVARVAPELSASLVLPSNRTAPQRPLGRHPAIPQAAVTQPGGTSVFEPTGAGGARFTFHNGTGQIIEFCPVAGTCDVVASVLLSGYVRFATAPPSTAVDPQALLSAEAETPSGSAPAGVGVRVELTQPSVSTVTCVTAASSGLAVPYYCAVPVVAPLAVVANYTWSGTSIVTGIGNLSPNVVDMLATNVKVCRYTPDASTDTAPNIAHPLAYNGVGQSLSSQNFLVIPAGNGAVAYSCPTDLSTTPLVDGDTRRHQPIA